MTDRQNQNASRIALYLENRLSPEDREAFKRDLNEDDELRLQYVDALMKRAGTPTNFGVTVEPPVTGTEHAEEPERPVEDHFEPVASVTEDTNESGDAELAEAEAVEAGGDANVGEDESLPEEYHEVQAKSGFLGSGWMVGVVALLLVIAGVVIFIMMSHGGLWNGTAATAANSVSANQGNGADSASATLGKGLTGKGADSTASGAGAGNAVAGGKTLGDSLYAKLYKPYMRGDDPAEVRPYYQDYRSGNYAAILAVGDSAVKIPLPRGLLVRDYMRLYVGLSYLATGDGRNAVSELGDVVYRTKPGDALYETGQWYLALAWLKRNDVEAAEAQNKALDLAREIARGYSRYREPAMEMVRDLRR